jgi:hypothetical protein
MMKTLSSAQFVRFDPIMITDDWKYRRGIDLKSELETAGTLDGVLPTTPAVYMWKTDVSSKISVHGQESFMGLIDFAYTGKWAFLDSAAISHGVFIDGISFKGTGVPAGKVQAFTELTQDLQGRANIKKFLQNVADYAPTLYVGDAKDLAARITDHLNENTGFSRRLASTDLDFRDLRLYFLETPDISENQRKALESLLTNLTGAWLVRRQG